jgi:hypothetical protein
MWYAWDDRDRPWKGLQLQTDNDDKRFFNAATTVFIGNGCKASFWTSRWLDGRAPGDMFPELFRHSKRKNCTVADALSDNKWVKDIDHNMSQQIIEQYLQLWDELQSVVLVESEEDKIIWTHSSSGEYSAKSAYDMHFQSLGNCRAAKFIWKTKAQSVNSSSGCSSKQEQMNTAEQVKPLSLGWEDTR